MAKYQLKLADGRVLTAIRTLGITWQVNDAKDISLGSACAAMLEAAVYDCPPLTEGERLECWEDGALLGVFYCRQPGRGGSLGHITGYDAMIRFDRDITGWLSRQTFPMPLQTLLENLCAHCGVALAADTALPEFPVEAFSQTGLTGRQLLQAIGQIAGGFFRIDTQETLRLGWYEQEETLTGYRMGSLTVADAPAAPIQRVLIRSSEQEAGAVWPDGSLEEANTYILQGNPLLPPSADRQKVAQWLYQRLKDYCCTGFSCTLLPEQKILPGALVRLPEGQLSPVMKLTLRDGQRRMEATASATLDSIQCFNRLGVQDLSGRVLYLERTAEGLKAEHTDLQGNAASLQLTLEGITARVAATEEQAQEHALKSQITELEQRCDGLSFSVTQLTEQVDEKADQETVEEITEHFLFDINGLTITNSATGMGIHVSEQEVAFTGAGSPTTAITPNAMQTTNLQVQTRLDVGGFSLIPRTNHNLSLRCTAS